MIKFNIIIDYAFKPLLLCLLFCSLASCLGGTIAQQIARSIATSVADKAMARALDVDEDQATSNRKPSYTGKAPSPNNQNANQGQRQATNHNALENSSTDPYKVAMLNAQFEPVRTSTDALPTQTDVLQLEEQLNARTKVKVSQLVKVELFNLLIADEKLAVYEKARLLGASHLPSKRDWAYWQVAVGEIKAASPNKQTITFLIPPEMGKLPSGTVTMVELAEPGELSIARYKAY